MCGLGLDFSFNLKQLEEIPSLLLLGAGFFILLDRRHLEEVKSDRMSIGSGALLATSERGFKHIV